MTAAKNTKDIRAFSQDQLIEEFTNMGEKAFRAKQVYEWLWKKSATSFEAMTNLSKALRMQLDAAYSINNITIKTQQHSEDGTIKFAFQLHDGHLIEGVLIPTADRLTACVSSQVGCSLSCAFCATGFLKRERNLNPDEVYDQYVLINNAALEHFNRPLTNVVFMGMGEPLLNYKNILAGIDRLTNEDSLNISPKRITVSTAGIAKMIRKLGEDKVKFNLALSLHATSDEARNKIMPINEQNNLEVLVEALNYFYQETKGRITFEYILLDDVNETVDDAKRLIQLARRVPGAKVNIIEYNPIDQADFHKPEAKQRDLFITTLENAGVTATLRRSRGKDIDAACGQLANKL
ncbi:MAG: 23S rRNA (adenine(2503)-C(2))-methyltransferase RlmN [Saprospiraceae bacterium]|nr:23S rRNA (adenine(2503)-C(2))-methyltransferase RlmN [Saprospiraceae bacterium]